VQHLLVTPDNPPRQTEGLDTERCAELHNAILEHGWLSSGRSAGAFQSQCTPSLKAFFQAARAVQPGINGFNFFYNVSGLDCAFGWHDYYTEDEDRVLTLYTVSEGLYSKPDGPV
jgi:hypothetical protein